MTCSSHAGKIYQDGRRIINSINVWSHMCSTNRWLSALLAIPGCIKKAVLSQGTTARCGTLVQKACT